VNEQVVGVRLWRVTPDRLQSISATGTNPVSGAPYPVQWEPGEVMTGSWKAWMAARHNGCPCPSVSFLDFLDSIIPPRCGVNAYWPQELWRLPEAAMNASVLNSSSLFAAGAVLAWGKVIEHELGFRAGMARPAALFGLMRVTTAGSRDRNYGTEYSAEWLGAAAEQGWPNLRDLSEEYGVPIVAPEHIQEFCAELGRTRPTPDGT
jgi:hypothetical protein